MRRLAVLVLAAVSFASCSRTVYFNLSPPPAVPIEEPADVDRKPPESWRHFFIWGWVPGERNIDAAEVCGGAEHVERIETRQTFVQGLIAILASYYINIYSPYTGAVVCDHTRLE